MKRSVSIILLLTFQVTFCFSQDTLNTKINTAYINAISEKAVSVSAKLDRKTEKVIASLERQEKRMYAKLAKADSVKAKVLLDDCKSKYASLRLKLSESKNKASDYIPSLDTFKTSLSFFSQNKQLLGGDLNIDDKISSAVRNVDALENSFSKAEVLKSFIKGRKESLATQMNGLTFVREFKKFNKEVYYYSAQIKEYKEILKDRKKVEKKAMEILVKSKPFKEFMRKNSQLASMFRLPGADEPTKIEELAGLQTRAMTSALVQERIGTDPATNEILHENLQSAQAQLSALKLKTSSFSSGSSNVVMPEGFKPNSQKTKSFFKRIEVGGNIQNQKAKHFFPITSDIAVSVGYKINDNGAVGLAASYKLGLGSGWNNLKLSHQGIGLRSYVSYKVKGNFFLTGGYEQNYRTEIRNVAELNHYSAWQPSGLIGITKKYKVNKKLNGNIQLLWDFMSYQQIPRPQPIVFRIGYSIR